MSELKPTDYIGISFWLISIALFATTVFLVIERESVQENGKHLPQLRQWLQVLLQFITII